MLLLTQINIYPVKSLGGYNPSSALAEPTGLQFDRRWMITDQAGNFITQRTCRKMTGLQAIIEDDMLVIVSKADPTVRLEIGIHSSQEPMVVRVWDDYVKASCVGEDASFFLSTFLGLNCRLVKIDDSAARQIDTKYATQGEALSFADAFPFMIIGEASFSDLNRRLDTKLLEPARRFRPNFVFSGGTPYAEDNWDSIKIGKVVFSGRKNCGRCMMINLDPDSGDSTSEPLNTLSRYRKFGNSIQLGRHMCLEPQYPGQKGDFDLRVGDEIEVLNLS